MYSFTNKVSCQSEHSAKIIFAGGKEFEIGPAPEFGGKEGILNPEEMIVGAVNSCLMMTLFYFLKKNNIEIVFYESEATGTVEKEKEGLRFTGIDVKAILTISSEDIIEKAKQLGQLAEKYCLVSRSLSCPVE